MPCNVVVKLGQGRFGWTETWARDTDDERAAATLTQADVLKYMRSRVSNVYLVSITASRVGSPGLPYEWLPPAGFVTSGQRPASSSLDVESQDVTATCEQIRFYTSNNRRSRHDVAALLDSDVILDIQGRSRPSPELVSTNNIFINWITSASPVFGMYRGERPVPLNRFAGILSIARSALNAQWTDLSLTGIPPGLDVGSIVRIGRVDQDKFPQLKGDYRVLAVAAGPPSIITVGYWDRFFQSPYIPAAGRIRLVLPSFSAFVRGEFVRFSEHKRGRPTERSVGRRRPVSRRQ